MRPAEQKQKQKSEVSKLAIYHMTTKPVSRKTGRTATASSAYRAGVELKDERTGQTFDYSKRSGVLFAQAFDKDRIEIDRSQLWNLAEQSENRKDARTAREYIIAIPFELIPKNESDKKDFNKNMGAQVAFEFAQEIAKKYDVAVDIAIHAPDKEGDNRNYHAHILTTTRKLERTKDGINLTDKSNIELSNKKLNELNLPKTQEQVKELREMWADTANKYLDNEQKIDHRSYADQRIDKVPTVKLGWKASALERKGIKTDRGDINRDIKSDNERIVELKNELYLERGRLSARNKKEELKEQHEQELREQIEQRRRQQKDKEPSKERPLTLLEKRELWKQKQAQQQEPEQKHEQQKSEPKHEPEPKKRSRGLTR